MAERRDYVALDWVSGEIEETLKQARQALEAYVADPDDATKLRFCLTYAHQVHGTLRMVEFEGATLFAREVEALAQALVNGDVASSENVLEILMGGLLQLPRYLGQVRQARCDIAGVLLPIVNEIRAVRGEALLNESALFAPKFVDMPVVATHSLTQRADQFGQLIKKLRQVFQVAFVGIIRNRELGQNLEYLARICQRLCCVSEGKPREALWSISLGIIEGLALRKINANAAVKSLLKQMDSELKALLSNGPGWLDEPPDQTLLREFLYLIARAEGGSPRIDALKQEYGLDAALAGSIAGGDAFQADPDAMKSVVAALVEELASIKDYLDIYLRSECCNIEALHSAAPIFKRLVNTMAVLGLDEPQQRLQLQAEKLDQYIADGGHGDPDVLLDIASAIISVEASLDRYGNSAHAGATSDEPQLDQAREIVVREARNGLEQAKEAIIDFVAGQWDHDRLVPAPPLLASVRGSLAMVGLTRAARVLQACECYVTEVLLADRGVPEWQALDTLADAVSGVDYYLERLPAEEGDGDEQILSVAEQRVAALGYALDNCDNMPTPVAPVRVAEIVPLYPRKAEPAAAGTGEDGAETGVNISADFVIDNAVVQAAPTDNDSQSGVADSGATTPGDEEVTAAEDDADDPVVDEILEIFIEEAGEVLETIADYLPRWRDNPGDTDALAEVRRAWHTLKGSGQMVGATDIGELAWSIENMLNRVLDHSVPSDPVRIAIVEKAAAIIPGLVKVLGNNSGEVDGEWLERIREIAFALAGQTTLDIAEVDAIDPAQILVAASADNFATDTDMPADLAVYPKADDLPEAVDVAASGVELPVDTVCPGDHEAADVTLLGSEPAGEQPAPESLLPDDTSRLAETPEPPEEADEEQQLFEIFEAEAEAHLAVIDSFTASAAERIDPVTVTDDLQRALHTLKGSAHMAGYQAVADVVVPVEHLIKEMQAVRMRADSDVITVLQNLAGMVRVSLSVLPANGFRSEQLEGTNALVTTAEGLRVRCHELVADAAGVEENTSYLARLGQFLADAADGLEIIEPLVADWHSDSTEQQLLCDQLDYLRCRAASLMLQPIAVLLAAWLTAVSANREDEHDFAKLLQRCVDELTGMLDALAGDQEIPDAADDLLGALRLAAEPAVLEMSQAGQGYSIESPAELDNDSTAEATISSFDDTGDDVALPARQDPVFAGDAAIEDIDSSTDWHDLSTDEPLVNELVDDAAVYLETGGRDALIEAGEPVESAAPDESTEGARTADEVVDSPATVAGMPVRVFPGDDDDDEEIREIFLEEARDLHESIDESILGWIGERENRLHLEVLQRLLHTLKGGARLTGLTRLGNLSHNFETFLINADQQNVSIDDDFFAQIQQFQDQVVAMIDGIADNDPAADAAEPVDNDSPTGSPVPEHAGKTTEDFTAPISVGSDCGDQQLARMRIEQLSETMHSRTSAEVVRVAANLLEELVNLAGETSISRGRVEEQVSEVSFALDEMDSIIERIQEQLRRLDIETEAQVLFRQEQVESLGLEEFDPLEMDRYSLLQQLSRSLMESASDIRDIKGTISEKARDIEALLLQQSRINTDLQEGLMRSRMVPFSRMVPRLRRIVRQVSVELNKRVELVFENTEGEMDRSLLERMVVPFEHMLRNAVDHGIESAIDRHDAGKSEQGTICISLAREGGDVIITLADDGRGISLTAVRAKAIECGLLVPEAKLSDREILQFILQPGFSTANAVTQISGRGVGMDVVHSEIKKLGGSIDIESERGHGTRFLIRLPFTVSVNRALMVHVGAETYALPLNTIEGIVRVSPFELEAYYQPDAPVFEYAGESYHLRYIGSLIGTLEKPQLDEQTLPLPVILVRSAEHTMAVQVDGLLSSREIVVKTLGPQFATVPGLSGATVLGDGSVVVILDLLALIRAEASQARHRILEHEPRHLSVEALAPTVMVVDDSVTVRKVTSRFLERNGFEVMLAKDGVDAVQQLQDRKPDLILLDIEMPRMDGFEVASRIKHSERLKDIPIIMITSRTGDKHRQRAELLGVDRYLGKPYQELELLKNIKGLTSWDPG